MIIAKVIVDVPASSINQTFDYEVPEKYAEIIQAGMRVVIPFGPRKITGFVVELTDHSEFSRLKSLIDVLDVVPVLTTELLNLGKWLAQDTLCLYIIAIQAMLPQALKSKYKKEYTRISDDFIDPVLENLFSESDSIDDRTVQETAIPLRILQRAVEKGEVQVDYQVKSNITKKYVTYIVPNENFSKLEQGLVNISKQATKQRLLIKYFLENHHSIEQKVLLETLKTTSSTVKELAKKEYVSIVRKEMLRNPYDDANFQKTFALKLTDEQQAAIEPIHSSIENEQHEVFLLHGITGSGKTEVYLQAIDNVISKGKEAIVLVPEIALTPQMVTRFKGRFGSKVAVMHSALSAGEKYDEWRKIHRKSVQVVVGARSAVFAPFENIGIIIIDEEHETTYKQEDQPRYHARDVAIKRGQYYNCPVVLGSATPTLESFARADKGVYHKLTLSRRTNELAMPEIEVVDMREELHAGNRTMFSRILKEKIETCLDKNEQIVLMLNRRGYSTFVMCRDCGFVKECSHCDIALTYHKKTNTLKCHYCSHEEPMPLTCPECEGDAIRYFGTGTQKVEEALTQLIPEARIIRMDVDTTSKKGAHEKLLQRFSNGEADILLGTQMIAKGLDFENVTLVGVLTADSMLHLPDFRSSERTFQLLTQVAGRAGRHHLKGEVIVQTYTPEHYSIEFASNYNFKDFYKKEMMLRKTFQYPPYVFLTMITVSDENEVKAIQTTQKIVQYLSRNIGPTTTILGPTPSAILRIKDRYRYQSLIKYKHEPNLRKMIEHVTSLFEKDIKKGLQIKVDLQPFHMM